MVKVGDFTVELVRADTKDAFEEHTAPDGNVYAEVEPDVEYFVSVGSSIGGVTAGVTVDGINLGYSTRFSRPNPRKYSGSWTRMNGQDTMTALRFSKTRDKRDGEVLDMVTGKVEVAFHNVGTKRVSSSRDHASPTLTGDPKAGGKKCVVSTDGSYTLASKKSKKPTRIFMTYDRGQHLRTITLHYCTALGLIYNKILPPPPTTNDDEPARLTKRAARKRSRAEAQASVPAVSPEKKKIKHETNGSSISVTKTYELVDLTGDDKEDSGNWI